MSKKICCVNGCDKEVHGLGYCNSHYRHYKRYGHPTDKPNKPTVCSVDGCNESVYRKGMCSKHYIEYRFESNKNKEPKVEYDECIVDGCTNKPCSKYGCYCGKHYNQIREHGHILERTIYDSNEIIKDEVNNCAYIVLYNKDGVRTIRTIIDLYMVDKVSEYKWRLSDKGYVETSLQDNKNTTLHQFVMDRVNANDGLEIDHINRHRWDNRLCNLRVVNALVNQHNKNKRNPNGVRMTQYPFIYITDNTEYIVKVNDYKESYNTLEEALRTCDYAVFLNDSEEFKKITNDEIVEFMKTPIVFDGKAVLNPYTLPGVTYYAIGKQKNK